MMKYTPYREKLQKNWAYWLLLFFFTIGLLHKFIANDMPIVGKHQDKLTFPIVNEYLYAVGWSDKNPRKLQYKTIIPAPIPYSPYQNNLDQSRKAPFAGNHLLGTDTLGRDLLSTLIYGTWKAILVGFFSISLALFIALLTGGVSGYLRDTYIGFHWIELGMYGFLLAIGSFYFINEAYMGSIMIGLLLLGMVLTSIWVLRKLWRSKTRPIMISPALITDKLIEIREAIPGIFLLLACLTFFRENSLWNVILIIGLLSWSNMARYIRSEIMAVKEETYILAARAMGYNKWRIFFRHILPNALGPIFSIISFTIASAILLEASLSFLGIGVPLEEPTWGSLLSEARRTRDWWMALFPGLAIFMLLISLHSIADKAHKY